MKQMQCNESEYTTERVCGAKQTSKLVNFFCFLLKLQFFVD